MPEKCARCGSEKIIPDVPLLDHIGDFGIRAEQSTVRVHGQPDALIMNDTAVGKVSASVCGSCGHAELFVSNARALYEKHAHSRRI